MLYNETTPHLLAGRQVRRGTWAPGISVVMSSYAPPSVHQRRALAITDEELRAMLSLALLTPAGARRYLSHSIDRRAADWELAYGPTTPA